MVKLVRSDIRNAIDPQKLKDYIPDCFLPLHPDTLEDIIDTALEDWEEYEDGEGLDEACNELVLPQEAEESVRDNLGDYKPDDWVLENPRNEPLDWDSIQDKVRWAAEQEFRGAAMQLIRDAVEELYGTDADPCSWPNSIEGWD